MVLNKRLELLFLAVCIVVLVSAGVTALFAISDTYQVRVTMLNQDPDPAQPDSYVDLRFKIENIGSKTANNATFELIAAYPFSLDAGETAQRSIGSLRGWQTESDSVIVRYRVRIDKNAVSGINRVRVRYRVADGGWSELPEYNVNIRSRYPSISIVSASSDPEVVSPGQNVRLSLELKNVADVLLRNVKISLGISSTATPFAPVGSTNEKLVEQIDKGRGASVDFELISEPDAAADVYKVPVTLTYQDSLGNNFSKSEIISLVIGDVPDLAVLIDSSTAYTAGSIGVVTVKFVNKGLSDIKFLNARVTESGLFELLSSDDYYVGKIESDDYKTADFNLFVKNADGSRLLLPLEVTYRDSNNRPYKESYDLSVRLYTRQEMKQLGLSRSSSSAGILVVLAVVVVGFIIYRKIKRRRKRTG
ncbi:hypothetical protein COT48_04510 [Candidatus Woesearchaeota archaeon CG08_land_8_20_14_0_20_47_9]|nr:MAG: hypothetical protein COT48_04510 [Candidatus Woesearchaeota archaeon CG08_land_8_20_14_0_20_47_9]